MSKYCYLNGQFIEEGEAKVGINDIGLLRGYAVFEYLRTFNGKPFLLDEHLARLEKSASELNLQIPHSRQEIAGIVKNLIKKNNVAETAIKIVLTGGPSEDGMTFDPTKATFYILLAKLPDFNQKLIESGVKMITFDHQREKASAKTTNYITKLSLDRLRRQKDAYEILYTTEHFILEGGTCNFFIFKGDALITPKDDILLGTTRNLVLKLAAKKFQTRQRLIPVDELPEATEAFLTSTTRGIVPVIQVDSQIIGSGKVGRNTKYLIQAFNEFAKKS